MLKQTETKTVETFTKAFSETEYISAYFDLIGFFTSTFNELIEEKKTLLTKLCEDSTNKIKNSSEFAHMTNFSQNFEISAPVYNIKKIEAETPIYAIECRITIIMKANWDEKD